MAATQSSSLRKKLDRFWSTLFLTSEGRPKSAMLLYSFCLALLFLAVYMIAYWFMIDWIEALFAGKIGVVPLDLLEKIVPGLLGSVPCCALWYAFKDKRIVPVAYMWLTLLLVAAMVTMALLSEEWLDFAFFLSILAAPAAVAVCSGATFTHILYRRYLAREALLKEQSETTYAAD